LNPKWPKSDPPLLNKRHRRHRQWRRRRRRRHCIGIASKLRHWCKNINQSCHQTGT